MESSSKVGALGHQLSALRRANLAPQRHVLFPVKSSLARIVFLLASLSSLFMLPTTAAAAAILYRLVLVVEAPPAVRRNCRRDLAIPFILVARARRSRRGRFGRLPAGVGAPEHGVLQALELFFGRFGPDGGQARAGGGGRGTAAAAAAGLGGGEFARFEFGGVAFGVASVDGRREHPFVARRCGRVGGGREGWADGPAAGVGGAG